MLKDDKAYVVINASQMKETLTAFGHTEKISNKILIIGGGNIGFNLAKNLEESFDSARVKIIEKDKEKFGDSDYILYLHTKGASKQNSENVITWRHLMNYFNVEKCKNVFKIFEKTSYNTYGVLLGTAGKWKLYSGNFWWAKASYLKTIEMDGVKRNRFNAEVDYIQNGIDWKPYSSYNREGENHYLINFDETNYRQ